MRVWTSTMKVIKLEVIVIDYDELGSEGVKQVIENTRFPNDCIYPKVRSIEVADIGPWSDDHPLNMKATGDEFLVRIFPIK